MKCIAYHTATGKRCSRGVVDHEWCLCRDHARMGMLRLLLECSTLAERRAVARDSWKHAGLTSECAAIRRYIVSQVTPPFGEDTKRAVRDAIERVPYSGTIDSYVAALLAVTVPLLQARVDTIQVDLDALREKNDRRDQALKDFVTHYHVFANFVPTHTH